MKRADTKYINPLSNREKVDLYNSTHTDSKMQFESLTSKEFIEKYGKDLGNLTEYKAATKSKHPESDLQTKITKWLKKYHPGLFFFSDFAAGLFLPPFYANLRSMQSCEDKYLDLTILRSIQPYHGLIIEIKCTPADLFLKDGQTLKSEHVQHQYNSILKLRKEGYFADFGVGEDDIKKLITDYLNGVFEYKAIHHFRGTMTQDKMDRAADEFFGGVG